MTVADESASDRLGRSARKKTLVVSGPRVTYEESSQGETEGGAAQSSGVASSSDRLNRSASAFYLDIVNELRERIEGADVGNPAEFHSLLWLTMSLGAKQGDVAGAMSTNQTVVSRWVHSGTTPEPKRRLAILSAAWHSLESELAKQVPFMPLRGRRAAIRSVNDLEIA